MSHHEEWNEEEFKAWLAFACVPGFGLRAVQRLAARDALSVQLRDIQKRGVGPGLNASQLAYLRTQAAKDVEACLRWRGQSSQRAIITARCATYPPLLSEIAAAPPVLFVEGDAGVLLQPQIAIVGSRNASSSGLEIAAQFGAQLAEQGLVVTSGLALGIDGYAHDGALNAGGDSVAVLGCGLEHIYPARHRRLAGRIAEQGALVSEFRPSARARAEHFPRRNRIISGLSLGVLVVEAAEKSGSLITARYASEQNRDVFVIPGSIHNAHSTGSNQLIRQGACLVQNVGQILDEVANLLDWSLKSQQTVQSELFSHPNQQEQLPFPELLANVGEEATPVDILASRTHIPVQDVMTQLLELELSGHVVAVSGGYIRKGRG